MEYRRRLDLLFMATGLVSIFDKEIESQTLYAARLRKVKADTSTVIDFQSASCIEIDAEIHDISIHLVFQHFALIDSHQWDLFRADDHGILNGVFVTYILRFKAGRLLAVLLSLTS